MRRSMRVAVGISVALLGTGCVPDTPRPTEYESPTLALTEVAEQVRSAELLAAERGRTERGPEDEILRVEARVPGVGGIFIDPDTRRMVVYVRDENRFEDARRETSGLAALAVEQLGTDVLSSADVEVRIGQYSFSELLAWKAAITGRLLELDGFVGIDADERANRVRVVVSSEESALAAYERISMARLPVEAFEVELGAVGVALSTLRSRFRPSGAGVQINGGAGDCTWGWTVTTSQGDKGLLTAGHCTRPSQNGNSGVSFYQPELVGPDFIGRISLNSPWNLSSCIDPDTGLYYSGPCTRADAMFISYSSASKKLARTTSVATGNNRGTLSFHSWWNSIGTVPPTWVGMSVDKIGRTTGWTRGTLGASCFDQKFVFPGVTQKVLVLCGSRVDNASMGTGDSGSPVFKGYSGLPIRPMGILFAADDGSMLNVQDPEGNYCTSNCKYWFSPWQQVNLHLGRYFDAQTSVPLTASISGPSAVPQDGYCTWLGSASGGSGSYTYSWSGLLTGSSNQISGVVSSGGTLLLTVNDGSTNAYASVAVWIDQNSNACPE